MNINTALSLLMLFSVSSELMAKHMRRITIVNMIQSPITILSKDRTQPTTGETKIATIPFSPFAAPNLDIIQQELNVADSQDLFVEYNNNTDESIRYQIPPCATYFAVQKDVLTSQEQKITLDPECVANEASVQTDRDAITQQTLKITNKLPEKIELIATKLQSNTQTKKTESVGSIYGLNSSKRPNTQTFKVDYDTYLYSIKYPQTYAGRGLSIKPEIDICTEALIVPDDQIRGQLTEGTGKVSKNTACLNRQRAIKTQDERVTAAIQRGAVRP